MLPHCCCLFNMEIILYSPPILFINELVSTGFIRLALNYKNFLQLQHQCPPRWQGQHQRALSLPLTLSSVNEEHGNISDRTIFTVFDALIMRLAEILRVFVNCDGEREKPVPNLGEGMHGSVELGQRRGDIMPVAYAFACLPGNTKSHAKALVTSVWFS